MSKNRDENNTSTNTSTSVVVGNARVWPQWLTRKAVIAAVSLIVVAGVIVVLVARHSTNTNLSNAACTEGLISQTKNAQGNVTLEQKLTKTIQARKNYTKDANCMYIVTHYYIDDSQVAAAQKSLQQLNDIPHAQAHLSKQLYGGKANITELTAQFKDVQSAPNGIRTEVITQI